MPTFRDHMLIGKVAAFVIVDDPHGYVAMTDGVQIVGRPDHGLRTEHLDMMQFGRVLHERPTIAARIEDEAPRIKGCKPKVRKLAKGLRP